jgi:hypothetical protein
MGTCVLQAVQGVIERKNNYLGKGCDINMNTGIPSWGKRPLSQNESISIPSIWVLLLHTSKDIKASPIRVKQRSRPILSSVRPSAWRYRA